MYHNEQDKEIYDIKKIAGTIDNELWVNDVSDLLYKKLKYKENEATYRLFKNIFIKKNLVKRDYDDLKNMFQKFIPDLFIKEVWIWWIGKIIPGISIKKKLNVMFLDIIGFTSLSEKLPPERSLLLLNIYFDGIVDIIKENGGYIDKFLWDGIMVIFDSHKSDDALKAAIEIQNFILKFQVLEVGKKLSVWIWINSWDVILWTIGSKKRMEITIIGDTVNTASRIESLTRNYKTNIIISDNTYKSIENKKIFSCNEIWLKSLRWRKEKIRIHGVDNFIQREL